MSETGTVWLRRVGKGQEVTLLITEEPEEFTDTGWKIMTGDWTRTVLPLC